ncbi:hypothetical protein P7K49_014930 [Saguinus oedipus]|uniref:Uncharacterized protein n=1 Tax=Saguinus oedipus TaxID=9490 RepID=A0ABQ9V7T0_SAGOE|nr:hypothetical protein P7K49_014930 [Saguinus oedipus]
MPRAELSPAGSPGADSNTGPSLGERRRHEKDLFIFPWHAGNLGRHQASLTVERSLILHEPWREGGPGWLRPWLTSARPSPSNLSNKAQPGSFSAATCLQNDGYHGVKAVNPSGEAATGLRPPLPRGQLGWGSPREGSSLAFGDVGLSGYFLWPREGGRRCQPRVWSGVHGGAPLCPRRALSRSPKRVTERLLAVPSAREEPPDHGHGDSNSRLPARRGCPASAPK